MWLLIDDMRDLNVDVIARTAKAGYKMLAIGGWEVILFDYDLGCSDTGADLLTWAIEKNMLQDAKINLVTSLPIGMERMQSALEAGGYIFNCTDTKNTYWEKK